MRILRWPRADRWMRSRRVKVGDRSLLSRPRNRGHLQKRNGNPHRAAAAQSTDQKAVPPCGGPNQAITRKKAAKKRTVADGSMPPFIAPQLCTRWSARRAATIGSTKSSSTATAFRCGSRDGEVTLKTRKGLDWTAKFGAIANAAGALPDCIMDGEIVALDHRGSPDFAGSAGRLVGWEDRRSDFFRLRSAVSEGRGFTSGEPCRPQAGFKGTDRNRRTGKTRPKSATSSISRAAATRCSNPPAECRWRASSQNKLPLLRFRTNPLLD